jgi:N-formylglutamate amidohydrolase
VERQIIKNEVNILTDWFTDEIFDLPYSKVVAPFSRIFCDVERFENDENEVMSQYGMGLCYSHTDAGETMREVTPTLRSTITSQYYRKHHDEFERLTTEGLSTFGNVIIIDCHSYPDKPMRRDLNQEYPRPDFCIGSDDFHTPEYLTMSAVRFLQGQGYDVKINNPYAGSIVPLKYYQKEKNVMSLMVEINRKLYMRTMNNEVFKTESFVKIKELIGNLVTDIARDMEPNL